jgi:non-heme Fe2+,alpha-ketoglutarate-dependent halogenase
MRRLRTDAYPELDRTLQFYPLGVETPSLLSSTQIESYNANGFLSPLRIFSGNEVRPFRDYFDELLPRAMAAGWGNYELTNWHKFCPEIYDLVTNSRILDIIADLLGCNIILRHSHFFAKLPGDGMQVSWHQDASYWPISPSRVVSAWLAIDDSDSENAALQVVPGSHRGGQVGFADSAAGEHNVLNQTVPNPDDYGDPVTLELKAGEMSLHSDWTLHGSGRNTSKRRRCGLAMRFLAPGVTAHLGWNEHSIVCRGEDPEQHWANNPRPTTEALPATHASRA